MAAQVKTAPIRETLRSLGPDVRVFGWRVGGKAFGQHRRYKPHLFVTGESRSGKGGTIRTGICGDLDDDNDVRIVAPDPGEFGLFDGAAKVGAEPEEWLEIIDEGMDVMNDRRRILKTAYNPETGTVGLSHFLQMDDPFKRHVIYFDELPAIAHPQAASLVFSKPEYQRIETGLASMTARGAKVGVNLVLGAQYPTIEYMFGRGSELGGGIKVNVGARIHTDGITTSLQALYDGGQGLSKTVLDYIRTGQVGRCVFMFLEPDDQGAAQAGQVMWINDADARAIAVDYINRRRPETV